MAQAKAGLGSLLSNLSDLLSFGGGDTCIGLSIGTSSIKLAELKKSGKTYKLIHFGVVQLAEDGVVNREIVNSVAVIEGIKTLKNQLKLKNKMVCTSLSGNAVIVKRMSIEVQNPKELQEQVFWEAEQYLPFEASDVVMDYHLLTKAKEKNADLILVAAKRSVLDGYMGAVEQAGLKPKWVDTDFFALQNIFEANYPIGPNEAVAVVDLGAASLKMVVVHGGVPVFTKDSGIGGASLTAEIQKQLGLSYSDAEAMKLSASGGSMPQEVSDLMQMMSDQFATEIKRSIEFYHASSTGVPVSYILLAGGSARIPELSRWIEEKVGLPTQLLNPFNTITYDPKVFTQDYLSAIGSMASVPIGLALRAGAK